MVERVAVLNDIHGNWPALRAVLAELEDEKPDRIVIGGDVVAGPMPFQTMEALLALSTPVLFLRGNADREVLSALSGEDVSHLPPELAEMCRWVVNELDGTIADRIAAWPLTRQLEIEGIGDVLFCHATPRDDNEIFTRITPEKRLLPVFSDVDAALVVCGHSHMVFDRQIGTLRVVNAGSVGMPYDGTPGANWLLLGPDVAFRRTDFDRESAAKDIVDSGYPQAADFVANYIHATPTEELALSIFEPRAIGN